VRSARGFLRPFENRKLRIAAMDHDPLHWVVALNPANLTSINRVDHAGLQINSQPAGFPIPDLLGPSVPAAAITDH